MASFDELEVENPNIREQYQSWRDQRTQAGEDGADYHAFREHLLAIGAPDPGDAMIVGFGSEGTAASSEGQTTV